MWWIGADFFYFGRKLALPRYKHVCDVVAEFVGTVGDNVVIVHNATTAVNAVLRSAAQFKRGDVVLMTDITYNAVKISLDHYCGLVGATIVVAKVPLAAPGHTTLYDDFNTAVVQSVQEALERGKNVKFALLDHISSMPSVIFPIKELVALCHRYGARVMVDGAHAPGQLPLNVEEVGADWYTGNLHKWSFTSKVCLMGAWGVAALASWFAQRLANWVRSVWPLPAHETGAVSPCCVTFLSHDTS